MKLRISEQQRTLNGLNHGVSAAAGSKQIEISDRKRGKNEEWREEEEAVLVGVAPNWG